MANRLKELRQLHNLTQTQLASKLNVAQNTLSYWESGKCDIGIDALSELSRMFNVSIDYLVGRSNEPSPNHQAFSEHIRNIFPLKTKKLPLLGEIACGEPIFADEQKGEYVITEAGINADFCLKAKGDSMIGARINDGDIVFVQSCPTVDNGEIAAVIIDNEATLKRVYYYPEQNKLVLSAENPRYAPFVYENEQLEYVRIIGRAVAFQSVII